MKKYLVTAVILILGVIGLITAYSQNPSNIKTNPDQFSSNFGSAQNVKETSVVELKNGDSYSLNANIVKKELNGQTVKMLAYNGSIPGPIIKVKQGSEITINLTNNLDIATTLHPHGVRLNNQFDGIPDVTQKAIPIGGNFSYKLKFPDAGVFWYHPHLREDYTQALGLYGNFIVEPADINYWSPVNEETPLVLSDILTDKGQIVPYNKANADHTFMGRFGNILLVNGLTTYTQTVSAGEVVRFYITNTASTRIFNLSIPGAKIKLVGGDNGRVFQEQLVDSVMIAPSERSIVDVFFEKAGNYQLIHKMPDKTYSLGLITVASDQAATSYQTQFNTLRSNPDVTTSIGDVNTFINKPDDKRLKIEADIAGMSGNGMSGQHMMGNGQMMNNSGMMMKDAAKIEWEDTMAMMNINSNPGNTKWKLIDQDTNKANNDIGWQFKQGDKVKLSIFNDPNGSHPMQHPIHIHGNRFLVLATNGVRNDNLQWKDTVLVQTGDTVDLLVEMSNPGNWMIHCHIPEHLESGMMAEFKVI